MYQALRGALTLIVLLLVLKMFFPEVASDVADIVTNAVHILAYFLDAAVQNLPAVAS